MLRRFHLLILGQSRLLLGEHRVQQLLRPFGRIYSHGLHHEPHGAVFYLRQGAGELKGCGDIREAVALS